MGYSTSFDGEFTIEPHLKPEHLAYLKQFANTRRVRRDPEKAELLPDPIRIAAGLPIGLEGAYFVGNESFKGQDKDASVIDGNSPPGIPSSSAFYAKHSVSYGWRSQNATWYNDWLKAKAAGLQCGGQPGLWCQWIPNDEGTTLGWDEGEKFYEYEDWLRYLIEHFLAPWHYTVNGEVEWVGEDSSDLGQLVVTNNVVTVKLGSVVYR